VIGASVVAALVFVVVVPETLPGAMPVALAAGGGNDVGAHAADLLKRYAGEIYGGIVAAISLVFLLNRRYTELGLFGLAAVVVAWMVFSPDQIAHTARSIGSEIL
jgi:hypothetical protein